MKDDLVGVRGGMQRVTDVLWERLRDHIFTEHKLVDISRGENGITLTFDSPENTTCVVRKHLILALPKGPLVSLVARNPQSFPTDMMETFDSVTALPLLKLFVIVAKKWWEADDVVLTNRFAQNFPTRECHTLKSSVPKSTRVAVLIYTEPPPTSGPTTSRTGAAARMFPSAGLLRRTLGSYTSS